MSNLVPSRLVLGTAGFDLAKPWRSHLKILHKAWDCGINCFDTAPIYAHGHAELILGKFLKNHDAFVHTKCGLTCRELPRMPSVAFRTLRFVKRLKSFFAKYRNEASHAAFSDTENDDCSLPTRLSASNLQKTFQTSLQKLGVGSVRALLLHEVTSVHANSEEIHEFFQNQIEKNLIQKCGVAGHPSTIGPPTDLQAPHTVYQTEGFEPNTSHFRDLTSFQYGISYSALRRFKQIQLRLKDASALAKWKKVLDTSLQAEESLACWLIAIALHAENVSQVVFFSSDLKHVGEISLGAPKLLDDPERLRQFKKLCKSDLTFDS
jgi:hypothetical protein